MHVRGTAPYLAVDLGAQDGAVGAREQRHGLVHVDEHLVLAVAQAVSPPVDGPRDLRREGRARVSGRGILEHRALVDVEAEHVCGARLRVAVVHRFVEELVDEGEVGL